MVVVDGVEMLSVAEAARATGRGPETVRRWIWAGRLPARKQGNRLMIARADLEALVRGHPPQPTMTLAEWVASIAATRRDWNRQPASGATAADLVFDDRRERSAGGPGAGR